MLFYSQLKANTRQAHKISNPVYKMLTQSPLDTLEAHSLFGAKGCAGLQNPTISPFFTLLVLFLIMFLPTRS